MLIVIFPIVIVSGVHVSIWPRWSQDSVHAASVGEKGIYNLLSVFPLILSLQRNGLY